MMFAKSSSRLNRVSTSPPQSLSDWNFSTSHAASPAGESIKPCAIVAGGLMPGNRHIVVEKGTPMTNLMLSMMDTLDVRVDKIGDSTGRLAALSA